MDGMMQTNNQKNVGERNNAREEEREKCTPQNTRLLCDPIETYVHGWREKAFTMNQDEYKLQRLLEKNDQNPHPRKSHRHQKLSKVGGSTLF